MKNSDDLFQLIKSLNKTEKRYFRLFGSLQNGDKKYIRVFEAIENQHNYDEKTLISDLEENEEQGEKNKNFVKQFPVIKHYLYNFILKCLESYHTNIESKLYSYLQRISILYEKRLFSQCTKIIGKAKVLAIKYEKHLELLKLLQWEIELIRAISYIGKTATEVEQIFQEMFAVEKKIGQLNKYSQLTSQLFITRKKNGFPRTKNDHEVFQSIIEHPFFAKVQNEAKNFSSLPTLAKCYFYSCYSNYYELKNDYTSAYSYAFEQVKLFEDNFHLTTDNPIPYIDAYRNLIYCQIDLQKYEEAWSSINQLRKFDTRSDRIKRILFYQINNMELSLLSKTGNINKGVEMANKILTEYNKLPAVMKEESGELFLYQNITLSYFYMGNYNAANACLNQIINNPKDVRNDIYCFSKILSLIIHFELDNQELLRYMVKSVYRFLLKRKRLYKVETIILDFIKKKAPSIHSKDSLLIAFKELKNDIKNITNDPFEKKSLDYFDFISWLDSKIENKSFEEVMKRKA